MKKVLILGYGSIGKRHAAILYDQLDIKDITLVTNQKVNGFKSYKQIEEVEHINEFDYFVIASETWKHYEQLKYLEGNVKSKNILVEKPLFDRYKKLKIAKNNVFIGYNLRFHTVLQKLHEELKDLKILYAGIHAGQYLPSWRPDSDYRKSYSSSTKKGGGVLLDLSHELDYIQWLFGVVNKITALDCKISGLEIDSDDLVTAIGITQNQTVVNMTMDYISKLPIRQITVHTEDLTYIGDLISNQLWVSSPDGKKELPLPVIDRNYTYLQMHQSIISNKFDTVCNYEDGLKTIRLIELIRKNNKWKEK